MSVGSEGKKFQIIIGALALMTGCNECGRQPSDRLPPAEEKLSTGSVYSNDQTANRELIAKAEFQPYGTSSVRGVVEFYDENHGIFVRANLSGVPKGSHGLHIHEDIDCVPPDVHAGPPLNESGDVGDLGNLTGDKDGKVVFEGFLRRETAFGTREKISGKTVILHQKKDDFSKQAPEGDSGPAIGCGVIRAVE